MSRAKQRKGAKPREVASVTPPLSVPDKKALDAFVRKMNKLPGLFTGSRFVFRDSVVILKDGT